MSTFRKQYRSLSDIESRFVDDIKTRAEALESMIIMSQEHSRERALALTKLEEAVMWAVKGVTG